MLISFWQQVGVGKTSLSRGKIAKGISQPPLVYSIKAESEKAVRRNTVVYPNISTKIGCQNRWHSHAAYMK